MSNVARRRRYALLCFVLAVLLLWLLITRLNDDGSSLRGDGHGTAGPRVTVPFTINASALEALAPGIETPLDLEFDNPYAASMSIDTIVVTLSSVTAPRTDTDRPCGTDDFQVIQGLDQVSVTIPAGRSRRLSDLAVARDDWPRVGMVNRSTNQDGCKGATLNLDFVATGTLTD